MNDLRSVVVASGPAVSSLRRSGVAPAGKVGICHRTGSASNPLIYIKVRENAVPAHQAHGDAVGVDLQTDPDNCGTCGNVCPGDACNTPVCRNGQCGTTAVVCNDNNACTADTCNPATGCVHAPISCDDGNACTEDRCDPATGCVHGPVVCPDDGNECTAAICDPNTGCRSVPVDGECADGTGVCRDGICSIRACEGAECGTFVGCNDNDACFCVTTSEGNGFCGLPRLCEVAGPCLTSADCPSGEVCAPLTCCEGGTCVIPCPSDGFSSLGISEGPNQAGR